MYRSLLFLLALCSSSFSYAHGKDCEQTTLNTQMQEMQISFKALKTSILTEEWERANELSGQLRALSQESLNERPELLHDIYDIERKDKELSAYQSNLRKLDRLLDKLARQAEAKNSDEMKILYSDIDTLVKESHARFNRKCK